MALLHHSATRHEEFAKAVLEGLRAGPKRLPSEYLFDLVGTSIYEQMQEQPEYYLTKREREILDEHAATILGDFTPSATVVDLGSGTGRKCVPLLKALLKRGTAPTYHPIDIDTKVLHSAADRLQLEFPQVRVLPLAREIGEALDHLPGQGSARFLLILGSNMGLMGRDDCIGFLSRLRRAMTARDRLVVGIDLVKNPGILYAAYNDQAGLTARFNKNILRRLNDELGANFDLEAFEHRAFWSELYEQVEMHLVSKHEQVVGVGSHAIHFRAGESIHTADWSKFTQESFETYAAAAGLRTTSFHSDRARWYGVSVLTKG